MKVESITLDGKGAFYGMGMLVVIMPGKRVIHSKPRKKMSDLKLAQMLKFDITAHRYIKHVNRNT